MNKVCHPKLLHKVSKNGTVRLRTSRMNFGVRREKNLGVIRKKGINPCNLVVLKLCDREKNHRYIKCNLSKGATHNINYRSLPAVIILSWESKMQIQISPIQMNPVNPEWCKSTQKVALEFLAANKAACFVARCLGKIITL